MELLLWMKRSNLIAGALLTLVLVGGIPSAYAASTSFTYRVETPGAPAEEITEDSVPLQGPDPASGGKDTSYGQTAPSTGETGSGAAAQAALILSLGGIALLALPRQRTKPA